MKNTIKIVIGILVIALISILVINKETEELDSINVGVISSLTGDVKDFGENFRNGVILAHEKYTAENPDSKIKLIIEDDGYETQKGLSAYKKLTELNKIDVLLNLSSPTINGIWGDVRTNRIPVMQIGEPANDPEDDNIFQLVPSNDATAYATGEYIKNNNAKKVAVVYPQDPTILKFVKFFNQGLGQIETIDYPVSPEEKDYRTLATKIIQSNPDTIVIYMFDDDSAKLLKEIFQQTDEVPQLVFGLVQSTLDKYKEFIGDISLLNGTIVTIIGSESNEEFISSYTERFGVSPGVASDWGYDAYMISISNSQNEKEDWIKNIKNTSYFGASGEVVFDEFGVRKPDFKIDKIQNGKLPEYTK